MNQNEKELKRILLESTPVLFLGAGFSVGSKNCDGDLPKGDGLRKDIFEVFVDDTFSENEREEINGYTLQELCQFIYDSMNKKMNYNNILFHGLGMRHQKSFIFY